MVEFTNDAENDGNDFTPKSDAPLKTNKKKIILSILAAALVCSLAVGTTAYQSYATKPASSTSDPTQGYNIHVEVGRHDSANLDAKMDHWCKLDTRIVAVCQLYAVDNEANPNTGPQHTPSPQLAQVEFIITDDQYLQLPLRERASWHNHAVELTPERGAPSCISLPDGLTCDALVGILQHTYGKVVTIWDPADGLPNYPPYVFLVDSPFALQQDTNDQLQKEWAVGNSTVSSAGDLPNCGIQQAGPCHP